MSRPGSTKLKINTALLAAPDPGVVLNANPTPATAQYPSCSARRRRKMAPLLGPGSRGQRDTMGWLCTSSTSSFRALRLGTSSLLPTNTVSQAFTCLALYNLLPLYEGPDELIPLVTRPKIFCPSQHMETSINLPYTTLPLYKVPSKITQELEK